MRNINLVPLIAFSLLVSACGGGGGGSNNTTPPPASSAATTSSASSAPTSSSSSSALATSSSIATTSSSSSSSVAKSSSSSSVASSTASGTILTIDMTAGWRGNGTGNSGVTYTNGGVSFNGSGDNIGAVFDVAKPVQLEGAVVTMVVNVSSEYKTSAANLQIFAQVKNTWVGEFNCWSSNSEFAANTDSTLTCTIDEADKRFNQSANDVQVGIQAKGTPTGVVTIKSVKITLAQATSSSSSSSSSAPAYSANVDHLKDLASFPVGVSVSNTDSPSYNILTNQAEKTVVEKHFNLLTAGNIMKVSYLHPTNSGAASDFTFTNADAFVDYAKTKNINIHGHALIWHSSYQVPNFMKNWAGTANEFLTMLDNHVTTIVTHYKAKGNVISWDVVNEALTDGSPSTFRTTDSTFYVKSGNSAVYIERAFQAARAADANVELYYNDYNIDQNNAKTTKLVEMITDFKARSIPITGVGFQMHVFMDYPSIENIKAAMKKVADVGLKVKITELDVALNNPYSNGWSVSTASTYNNTTALAQKKRYCDIVAGYKEVVPAAQRGGITVWGTTDANTWLTTATSQYNGQALAWPLLFDNNYNDKPALRGFADGLSGTACTNL